MARIIEAADLFCGAGGTSSGLYKACHLLGAKINLVAINHWPVAVETHRTNYPDARHICASLDSIDPRAAVPSGHLDLLVASPECTYHSVARGGKPINDQLRSSAWQVLRWVELLNVDSLLCENVQEWRKWGPLNNKNRPIKSREGEIYQSFLSALRALDYTVEDRVLNTADYGDPTSRYRLFIQAHKGKKKIIWPEVSHGISATGKLFGKELKPYRTAREIIDWNVPSQSIFKRKKPLVVATMKRIEAGLRKYGGKNAQPFLVMICESNDVRSIDRPLSTITTNPNLYFCEPFITKYYGTGSAVSINEPLDTITTRERFALVEPCSDGHTVYDIRFRMLQPHELAAATSFARDYRFTGNKTAVIKQIGNAVPVQTATSLCMTILGRSMSKQHCEQLCACA